MIDKLRPYHEEDRPKRFGEYRPPIITPTFQEVVNKVNELVEAVNKADGFFTNPGSTFPELEAETLEAVLEKTKEGSELDD